MSHSLEPSPNAGPANTGPANTGLTNTGLANVERGQTQRVIGAQTVWRKLNLLYLVFAVLPLLIPVSKSALLWGATALAIVLFLPVYWRSFVGTRRQTLLSAGYFAAIGLALSSLQSGGSCFVIYAVSLLNFHQRAKFAFALSIPLIAMMIVQGLLRGYHPIGIFSTAFVAIGVMFGASFAQREERFNLAMTASREELVKHATAAERERISRDLHDLLGHTLSLIAIKSELARKLAPRDLDASIAELRTVETIAREALAQVREAVTGMRATEFSGELASAKVNLLSAGLRVNLDCEALPNFSSAQSQTLGLILREAVTNILRHADASEAWFRARVEAPSKDASDSAQFFLEIRDDGVGFDPNKPRNSSGLRSMRERIAELAGSIEIQSAPGQGGSALRLRMPLSSVPRRSLAEAARQTSLAEAARQTTLPSGADSKLAPPHAPFVAQAS